MLPTFKANKKQFLANEFHEFWNAKNAAAQGPILPKIKINIKIKKIADYQPSRKCWMVKDEFIKQHCSTDEPDKWEKWEYILEQPNLQTLPPSCTSPSTRTGDISCEVEFSLEREDKLAVTWYEPSHASAASDNTGPITVDVYCNMEGIFIYIILYINIIYIFINEVLNTICIVSAYCSRYR